MPGLRLQRSLGRGAHGEVWAAVDLGSGEQVAVKLRRTGSGRGSRPSPRGDDEAAESAERLAREIALLRRIDHPHVVRLRRVLDLPDGARAMVLDHAAGGSLAELIRARGPLQPGEVVTLLVALARALADLHAGGIVHGDLAPGNVLFTDDGRPLLSDLGLGTVLGGDHGAADWATPGFAEPAGLPAGDPARDIWGLGAVAWFALTGRPPAGALADDPDRRTPDVDRADVDRADIDRADIVPGHPAAVFFGDVLQERAAARRAALLRLVRDCLAAEPEHRPEAADVARRAWRAVPPAAIRLVSRDREPVRHTPAEPVASESRRVRPGGGPVVAGPWPASGAAAATGVGAVPVPDGVAPVDGPGPDPDSPHDEADDGAFLDVTRRVREAAGDGAARRGVGRGGRAPRRLVGAAGALAAALLGGGVGWAVVAPADRVPVSGAAPSPPPPPDAAADDGIASQAATCLPADPSGAELARVVCDLARGRAEAFAAASTDPLAAVDEPGSPAMAADTGLVQRLRRSGLRLDGVVFGVTGVRVQARTGDTVRVAASVTTSAHRQVRADGTVAARVPAAATRRTALVLVRRAGGTGWRVRSTEGL